MSAILEPMLPADIAHCADLMTCSGTLIKLVKNYFNRDEIGGNKMPRKRSRKKLINCQSSVWPYCIMFSSNDMFIIKEHEGTLP